MDQVQSVLDSQGIVPHDVLSILGRKTLQEALQDGSPPLDLADIRVLWMKLQETACSSLVTNKHLTAACNAICVFVHRTHQSERHEVRSFAFSTQVWFGAFEVVHKAFSDGKNKPALQVLEMLAQILHKNEDRGFARAILSKAVSEMVVTIFVGEPENSLKEACIVLSCFLQKAQDIVPISDYFTSCGSETMLTFKRRCRWASISSQQILGQEMLVNFFMALLLTASVAESRVAAIKLFALLCSKNEKVDFSQNIHVASRVIETYLQANDKDWKGFFTDVFSAVLTDEYQFNRFLNQFVPAQNFTSSRLSIFLAIVQVGRQKGFVTEKDIPYILESALNTITPRTKHDNAEFIGLRGGLMCGVSSIRLQVLYLLTFSNATAAAIPSDVLQCYSQSLRYMHDDTDTFYRDEYVSISRRLIDRLEQSGQTAKRLENSSTGTERNIRSDYAEFLQSWTTFLCMELSPQVSYQRHILALRILHLVVAISPSSGQDIVPLLSEDSCILPLLDLVFDAFDDVRSSSTALLIKIASRTEILSSILKDRHLIAHGKTLSASTNRADHADAAGRLLMLEAYTIVCSTRFSIPQQVIPSIQAISDITDALRNYLRENLNPTPLSNYPLHANLLGLSYLLDLSSAESIQVERITVVAILEVCHKIWIFVQKHLCVDSPETEQETDELNTDLGPKDLLAYSWRALRDSSLVMQALLNSQTPDHSLFLSIGTLCFEQLTRLRHRGAFSTVAQTFAQCCQKSRGVHRSNLSNLNETWLETKAAFNEIEQQSGKLTRRSAGLPSMFAALLDPLDPDQFLAGVQRLAQIARSPVGVIRKAGEELRLPQVHAINCLKDVMTNSRFRVVTESLVGAMLTLSAQSLSSKTWAIRNCGLMLFRACINRLTPGASVVYGKQATSISGDEIQTPLAVGIALLQQGGNNKNINSTETESGGPHSEIVFATLDLLSRISDWQDDGEAVDRLITIQFNSKLWAVRDHAARLKASRTSTNNENTPLRLLIPTGQPYSSNELHGRLLSSRYMLKIMWSGWELSEKISRSHEISLHLEQLVKSLDDNIHQLVLAVAMDTLNDIFTRALAENYVSSSILECTACFDRVLATGVCDSRFFLLRRATALNRACLCIHQARAYHQTTVVDQVLEQLLGDHDVVLYVIEELIETVATTHSNEVLQVLLLKFSVHQCAEIRATALKGISKCFLSIEFSPTDAQIEQLKTAVDFQTSHSRDLWNAQICFAANVAVLCHSRASSSIEEILYPLMVAIRTSQLDEVEMPTRLHAAEAISAMAPLLFSNNDTSTQLADEARIRLLLVLYDFLNDDDEDIRAVASAATYNAIKHHTETQQVLTGCAVAARETLIATLIFEFGHEHLLVSHAFLKMIGITPSTGVDEMTHLITFCRKVSVSHLIDTELQRASDLFAEERQNLYIDDIAEIETWSAVIRQHLNHLEKSMLQVLLEWTDDGLQCLVALLQQDLDALEGKDDCLKASEVKFVHPLGLTYNAEILITCVRVVTVAGLVRRHGERAVTESQSSALSRKSITDRLHTLWSLCQSRMIHKKISAALKKSLED